MQHIINYRKRLRTNIIQFAIGSTLLLFVSIYLINHPQEKASLFNGIGYITDNIWVKSQKLLIRNPSLRNAFLERRTLVQDYRQLAHKVRTTCDNPELTQVLENRASQLAQIPRASLTSYDAQKTIHESWVAIHTHRESLPSLCPQNKTITLYPSSSTVIAHE